MSLLQELVRAWAETQDESVLLEALTLARQQFEADPAGEHRIVYGQLLVARYQTTVERPPQNSIRSQAFEAIVTGIADQVDPVESLAVRLPPPAREPARQQLLTTAIEVLGPDDAGAHPLQAVLLASAHRMCYQDTNDPQSLRHSLAVHGRLLAEFPDDPELQHAVATDLLELDAWTNDAAALKRAVSLAHQAATSGDDLDPDLRVLFLTTLTTAYRTSYDRTCDPEDLAMAQGVVARVASAIGENRLFSATCAHLLGTLLARGYHRLGQTSDLHAAITCLRTAADEEDTPQQLADLADTLRLRWSTEADDSSRLEAFTATQRCAGLIGARQADAHLALYAHGCSLLAAGETADGDSKMIDAAVVFFRLALGLLPDEHPARAGYTGRLADAWLLKYGTSQTDRDLAGALEATAAATRLTPRDHPDRARHLNRFGLGMVVCFVATLDEQHLWKAIRIFNDVQQLLPDTHPYRCEVLLDMARATLLLADHLNDDELRAGAQGMLRQAVQSAVALAPVQLEASLVWGELAAAHGQWREAAIAYRHGMIALRELMGLQLTRGIQENRAAQYAGLVGDAVATALHADAADSAPLVLEFGRGVLLGRQLDLTAQQSLLSTGDPRHGARMAELLRERQEAAAVLDGGNRPGGYLAHQADSAARQLRRASEQLVALLAEQRELLTGDLGRVYSAERLVAAARQGPLIMVNLNRYRSDAIIVRSTGITVLPLTHRDCTADTATRWAMELADAGTTGPDLRQVVSDMSAWLWTCVVGPVLAELGYPPQDGARRPRVWWLPAGPLALLPLHAAGLPAGPNALDAVVSSYTPTLRTLSDARRAGGADRIQATVGMQHTAGAATLRHTVAEVRAVHAGQRGRTLLDADATGDQVLGAFAESTWAHLACHGVVDPGSPSRSGLVLHDRTLTVAEIVQARYEPAQLAYLSACSTARSSVAHADEAIHLTSAFQVAGFRNVIGTLWAVPDKIAADTARLFYASLGNDVHRCAETLHQVTHRLRAAWPSAPQVWSTLIHSGA